MGEVVPPEVLNRGREQDRLLRDYKWWVRKFHLCYELGWDVRARAIIDNEMVKLRRKLAEDFGLDV